MIDGRSKSIKGTIKVVSPCALFHFKTALDLYVTCIASQEDEVLNDSCSLQLRLVLLPRQEEDTHKTIPCQTNHC